jgi:3-deoxy-manno-octulosonate cytidylyltransferase (CMP-KDO synthetase)
MIQWVYERSSQCDLVNRVIVATDDQKIAAVVKKFGGDVRLTRSDHASGTDRLAEVADSLEDQLIVNVQGDEPLITADMISAAVAPLLRDPSIPMGTLKTSIVSLEEYQNPHVVKVVTDQNDFALYFSRASIPFARDFVDDLDQRWPELAVAKHIGLYVYRRDFLLAYPKLSMTPLEKQESLEQLRALEHGYRIFVAKSEHAGIGVDTPDDLEKVRQLLKKQTAPSKGD